MDQYDLFLQIATSDIADILASLHRLVTGGLDTYTDAIELYLKVCHYKWNYLTVTQSGEASSHTSFSSEQVVTAVDSVETTS